MNPMAFLNPGNYELFKRMRKKYTYKKYVTLLYTLQIGNFNEKKCYFSKAAKKLYVYITNQCKKINYYIFLLEPPKEKDSFSRIVFF